MNDPGGDDLQQLAIISLYPSIVSKISDLKRVSVVQALLNLCMIIIWLAWQRHLLAGIHVAYNIQHYVF